MGSDRDDDPRRWPDGVEVQPASREVLAGHTQAREQLMRFQAPLLTGASKPNGRVFVANFDGTGNNRDKYPDEKTNVADIYEQIKRIRSANIGTGYQSGIGTQDNEFVQKLDGAAGYSYGPRMERMYYDFCMQAKVWRKEAPNAEISLAAVGFSRGAVTAALFTRMVEERGIRHPDSMIAELGPDGQVVGILHLPAPPPLVPPGQTPQVVGLFDPVATGVMNEVDVRLPPSVVSGFQITALDERRDQFKSKQIIDPGMSQNGRFLGVQVGGAHCDIGGSYRLDGLSIRSGNLMDAYLNAISDRPFLRERTVPTAPEMNVIHDSTQHQWFYTSIGAAIVGERIANERLTPPPSNVAQALYQRAFSNTHDAEPRNEALTRSLRYRHIPVGPEREDPSLPDFFKHRPKSQAPEIVLSEPLPGIGSPLDTRPMAPLDPLRDIHRYSQRFSSPISDIQTLAPVPVRPDPEVQHAPSPQTITLPIPDHLQDFRHPEHPQHGRYQDVLREVHRMEEASGIAPGPHSERMAAAWVDELARNGKGFVLDRFEMRSQDVVALSRRDNYFEPQRELSLNADQALARPVEQASADWVRRAMPYLGQPQTLEPSNPLADHRLRHPDPTRQAQHERLREQVTATYARAGIVRSETQLDRVTAAVALDMQRYGLERADRLYLLPNRDGSHGPDSGIGALQGQYPLQLSSQTSGEALQQAPDESYRQLAQVTQQQAIEQQRQAVAAQPQGPQLG